MTDPEQRQGSDEMVGQENRADWTQTVGGQMDTLRWLLAEARYYAEAKWEDFLPWELPAPAGLSRRFAINPGPLKIIESKRCPGCGADIGRWVHKAWCPEVLRGGKD